MTQNVHKYVGYVPRCPKCGRRGYLYGFWHRRGPGRKWTGPYYRIDHKRYVWSPEKWARSREMGLSSREAKRRSHNVGHPDGHCYFGRTCPVEVTSKHGQMVLSKMAADANRQRPPGT